MARRMASNGVFRLFLAALALMAMAFLSARATGQPAERIASQSLKIEASAEGTDVLRNPMKFQRVRLLDAACEPNCPEWLSAEGDIVRGTAEQFRQALAQFGDRKVPILISSGGGIVEEGFAMGRLIRERRMAVGVAKTRVVTCVSDIKHCDQGPIGMPVTSGAYCFSACALVLAGGADRFASTLSAVGVHQARAAGPKTIIRKMFRVTYRMESGQKREVSRQLVNTQTSYAPETASDLSEVEQGIKAYYAQMGIDERVFTASLATPSNRIDVLSGADLRSMRLVTSPLSPYFFLVRSGKDTRLSTTDPAPTATPVPDIVAIGSWSLPFPSQRRDVALEATFTYSKGETNVIGAFTVRETASRFATEVRGTGLTLLLRPSNASFHTEKSHAASTLVIAVPLAEYCKLRTNGAMIVTYSDRSGLTDAEVDAEQKLQGEPPTEIDPWGLDNGLKLFEAACPGEASAAAK